MNVNQMMRLHKPREQNLSTLFPSTIPMSKRVSKFNSRPLVNIAERVRPPEYRAFLEIAYNGVISIGLELGAEIFPFHVWRRLATRFNFDPSIMSHVCEYVGTKNFDDLKKTICENYRIKFIEGGVQAWICAEGMGAYSEISDYLSGLEKIHVRA